MRPLSGVNQNIWRHAQRRPSHLKMGLAAKPWWDLESIFCILRKGCSHPHSFKHCGARALPPPSTAHQQMA